jgi:microcystin-dependent protein
MTINLPNATSSTLGGVKSSTADGKISVNSDGTMSMNGGGISIWEPNKAYEVDAVVIDSNLIWQCATAHTSTSTFDKSKWVCLSGAGVAVWQPDTDYEVQNVVIYNYALYICREAHTSTTDFEYNKWVKISGEGSSSDPIGTIISYMGITPPRDYLACDGTIYNIADYQDLADHINTQFGSKNFFGGDGTTTFAVPDLRGEFLRGTGTNSHAGQGSGANVGVHQDGTEHTRVGLVNKNRIQVNPTEVGDSYQEWAKNYDSALDRVGYTVITAEYHASAAAKQGQYTSRPTNTSVLYCIKYKNSGITYSTGEQRIGTWIDGKPLYQKTYIGTTPSTADVNADVCSIPTISSMFVIDIKGVVILSDAYVQLNDSFASNTHTKFWVSKDSQSIRCNVGINIISQPCYITLQYTKTTD